MESVGKKNGMVTLFVDVMRKGRYVFTLRYRFCPLFNLDLDDVYAKVLEKRPSLKGEELQLFFD